MRPSNFYLSSSANLLAEQVNFTQTLYINLLRNFVFGPLRRYFSSNLVNQCVILKIFHCKLTERFKLENTASVLKIF